MGGLANTTLLTLPAESRETNISRSKLSEAKKAKKKKMRTNHRKSPNPVRVRPYFCPALRQDLCRVFLRPVRHSYYKPEDSNEVNSAGGRGLSSLMDHTGQLRHRESRLLVPIGLILQLLTSSVLDDVAHV